MALQHRDDDPVVESTRADWDRRASVLARRFESAGQVVPLCCHRQIFRRRIVRMGPANNVTHGDRQAVRH